MTFSFSPLQMCCLPALLLPIAAQSASLAPVCVQMRFIFSTPVWKRESDLGQWNVICIAKRTRILDGRPTIGANVRFWPIGVARPSLSNAKSIRASRAKEVQDEKGQRCDHVVWRAVVCTRTCDRADSTNANRFTATKRTEEGGFNRRGRGKPNSSFAGDRLLRSASKC
jgi:hypothetical protein